MLTLSCLIALEILATTKLDKKCTMDILVSVLGHLLSYLIISNDLSNGILVEKSIILYIF